jgi:hypothetical protein
VIAMMGVAVVFFYFNDTATTEICTTVYTLSLHDALPISGQGRAGQGRAGQGRALRC